MASQILCDGVTMEAFRRTVLKSVMIHLPLNLFAILMSFSRIVNLYFISLCQCSKLFCFTAVVCVCTQSYVCVCSFMESFSSGFCRGIPACLHFSVSFDFYTLSLNSHCAFLQVFLAVAATSSDSHINMIVCIGSK